MDRGRKWVLVKLAALEEFAKLNTWNDIADLLRIARRTAAGDLQHASLRIAQEYKDYEDDWFENAIDQLTRYAYESGLPQVEAHLIEARAAWDLRNAVAPDTANNPDAY